MVGVLANLCKQHNRFWLGRYSKLGAQQIEADLVLVQCGCPLATSHEAAHHQAMRILAAGIACQEMPEILQSRTVIASAIRVLG